MQTSGIAVRLAQDYLAATGPAPKDTNFNQLADLLKLATADRIETDARNYGSYWNNLLELVFINLTAISIAASIIFSPRR